MGLPKGQAAHFLRVHRGNHEKHPIESIAFMIMNGFARRFVVIPVQGAIATVGIENGIPVVQRVQVNPGFAGSPDKIRWHPLQLAKIGPSSPAPKIPHGLLWGEGLFLGSLS